MRAGESTPCQAFAFYPFSFSPEVSRFLGCQVPVDSLCMRVEFSAIGVGGCGAPALSRRFRSRRVGERMSPHKLPMLFSSLQAATRSRVSETRTWPATWSSTPSVSGGEGKDQGPQGREGGGKQGKFRCIIYHRGLCDGLVGLLRDVALPDSRGAVAVASRLSHARWAQERRTRGGPVTPEPPLPVSPIPRPLSLPPGLAPTADVDAFINQRSKELNNGRLAMIAWAGMVVQELISNSKIFS